MIKQIKDKLNKLTSYENLNISNYTKLYSIVKDEKASNFKSKYKQIFNNDGYIDLSLQFKGENLTLRLMLNIVIENLYFSLYDSSGLVLQNFMPLIEYPNNLIIKKELLGLELYLYENTLYYKSIE